MRWLALGLALCGGCASVLGIPELTSGGCYGRNGVDGAGLARVCLDAPPPPWEHPARLATGSAGDMADCTQLLVQAGTEVCVIARDSIELTESVPLVGSRPLILLAATTLKVDAPLDLHGVVALPTSTPPAGANDASCPGVAGVGAYAGGAGGSFGGKGGDGGASSRGMGGMARAIAALASVRGGCAGGPGAGGSGGGSSGIAGGSGGALYLIAGDTITVSAAIDASGAAGRGGGGSTSGAGGGGGGGSGGLLGFDAPMIVFEPTSQLVAIGAGGGGGGGLASVPTDGQAGTEAKPAQGVLGSTGGAGGTTGGGRGGAGEAMGAAEPGVLANGVGPGGGGGGGGNGAIRVYAPVVDDRAAAILPAKSGA